MADWRHERGPEKAGRVHPFDLLFGQWFSQPSGWTGGSGTTRLLTRHFTNSPHSHWSTPSPRVNCAQAGTPSSLCALGVLWPHAPRRTVW
eukprot:773903-Prymnesium_polylepis.1